MKYIFFLFSLVFVILFSCKEEVKKDTTNKKSHSSLAKAPVFSGENAYDLVAKQLEFGPRNPNSEGHEKMAVWMIEELKKYGYEGKTILSQDQDIF